MSGLAASSHSSSRGSRAFTEFTFQVARRTRIASHRPRGGCTGWSLGVTHVTAEGGARFARLVVVLAEAFAEAAEDAALVREWLPCRGRFGALAALGLVVVGPRNGVHDLRLVERVRAGDLRYEADQIAVEQDLGFQAGRALGTPDRLASAACGHLHRVCVDAGFPQVRVDATVPERIGDPAGSILVHARQATQAEPSSGGTTATSERPGASSRPRAFL